MPMKFSNYFPQFRVIFIVIITIAIAVIAFFGMRIGIDFTGGALTEVSYTVPPIEEEIITSLDALTLESELGSYSLREIHTDTMSGYALKTRALTEAERVAVHGVLQQVGEDATVTRFTTIGPVIGQELADKAWWAIAAILLSIIFYVAYVFRNTGATIRGSLYGFSAIIVLAHDLLVPAAVMSLLGYFYGVEIDTLFVVAMLAILGYSVNDTVVVFDRVRERLHTKLEAEEEIDVESLPAIVGAAMQSSFGRSINTSLTTLIALGSLCIFGGAVTQTFALILMVGVVAGTYSSLFIAGPLLAWLVPRFPKHENNDLDTTYVLPPDVIK